MARSLTLALCLCSATAFAPSSNVVTTTSRVRQRSELSQLDFSVSSLFQRSLDDTPTESYLPQVNHRHSAKDWVHNIASLPHSSILQDVRNPVLAVMAWSSVVAAAHRLLISSANPVWNAIATNIQVGATAHSFLVSSLGLLLVFRTNSAYQRFAVSSHPHSIDSIHSFSWLFDFSSTRFTRFNDRTVRFLLTNVFI